MTTAPTTSPDFPAAVAHNVPSALSSFIGRARDVAEVTNSLARNRLVTLVGAGGAGKTRLAREVAAGFAHANRHDAAYPDGVWWVELAPLRDGADVATAVAAALGVSPSPGRRLHDALSDALRGQRLLLVLDNCEHVVDDAAQLVDSTLRSAATLTVLATSREPLAIDGEVSWLVPPLDRPVSGNTDADGVRATDAAKFDAVQLFVERARAASPGFVLTDANVDAVATICARLDGLPLALELAAAVVPVVGVDGIVDRLDDALTLLSRGRRTALPRHRTLRAVLDWSYALLTDDERILLRRLSVFRGSFTLDAIEDVCSERGSNLITALGRLVEHSLVDVREEHGESRYRLLETVRQYGSTLLHESPDEQEVRSRHARWVATVADAAEPALFSPARGRTVERLRQYIDEIRAALVWATGPSGSPMVAVQIAGALSWFWFSGVPWEEARTLLALTMSTADAENIPDAERPLEHRIALGRLQYPIEGLAFFAGDTETMLVSAERDLAIWDTVDGVVGLSDAQRLTAARGRALSLQLAGIALAMRGDASPAVRSMNQCIDVARASGDEWLFAVMMMRRALVHFLVGDFESARRDYETAVPALRHLGEWWFLSLALEGMATTALAVGDASAAMCYARESITVLRPEPDAWFISRSLDTMAYILVSGASSDAGSAPDGQAQRAARLLGAAESLRRRCGAAVIGPDLERNDRMYATLRDQLGVAAFDEARDAGAELSLQDVFAMMDEADALTTPAVHDSATPDDQQLVTLQVLGPFVLERGGRAVSGDMLPVGKTRELLLFLLMHERATKEAIGLALWPDASPAQVRNTFHVTLHNLRKTLGAEPWIVFEQGGYRLERAPRAGVMFDVDVDAVLSWSTRLRQATRRQQQLGVTDLADARRALDRSHGDLGQNLATEDWLVMHQDRVRNAWADGMDALAQQYLAIGQHADVIAVCTLLIDREPLREGAHRLLMQALVAIGEPARALAHFNALAAMLEREVGARPASETRALAERIRG